MYYKLKNDISDKVAGKDYPQVDCLTMPQAHLITSWHLFDPKPRLKFALRNNALLTDILNDITIGGGTGFLISSGVKDILDRFNLMRHQYFSASVELNNGEVLEYYWLHLSDPDLTKKLDYKRTTFYKTEWTFREGIIKLRNYEHYLQLKAEDKEASFGIETGKTVLSDSFDKTLDMFTFLPFDNNVYISEKLKNALTQNNLSGFLIEKADKFALDITD